MTVSRSEPSTIFDDLEPGDRIVVEHEVTVGAKSWTTERAGIVVRIERRRHGLHHQRSSDDQVYSDTILMRAPDEELTTVTMDEFTTIRRA